MDSWLRKDSKYIWHPYTQMKDCRKTPPILIEKARGIKLYDTQGNFFYDTISSWWCNVHGHNHPRIKKAIEKQLKSLDHVLFAGFTHRPAILLAEKLIAITPKGLSKVFFSDNGSTAVETALKMSFQYWQNTGRKEKKKFISLDYAYHGDTIGAMSVGGVDLFSKKFRPLFFPSFKVPAPYCYRCPVAKQRASCSIECISLLEKMLKKKNSEIAALIIEPLVLAAGGMIIYPAEYLKYASKLARKYNIHLILDEVATGFGRTGKMFACEYANIQPDLMCLAKGLTSGTLPLAVTLTTEKIYRAFYADVEKKKTFYHGHTFSGNPIACSVALASLEIFKQEKVLGRVERVVPRFHQGLERFKDLPFVGEVRALGLIGAIELVKDKKTKQPFSLQERIGQRIYLQGLKQKLILRPLGNVVYFYFPLCVKDKEITTILNGAFKVLQISFNIKRQL
ncbi:MAG: adenosylmethionine--8-amino-7-oxononanoate transaminase [Omnitrophica bacterium]|nr:adenosylmethionine--8-amino-7-oxononanoate transaminase [Candidatus Omnitrophota bacterium]